MRMSIWPHTIKRPTICGDAPRKVNGVVVSRGRYKRWAFLSGREIKSINA